MRTASKYLEDINLSDVSEDDAADILKEYLVRIKIQEKFEKKEAKKKEKQKIKEKESARTDLLKKKGLRDYKLMRSYRKENILCEMCEARESIHTHHIVPFSEGGEDSYKNYMAVCLECHSALHPELPEAMKKNWFVQGNKPYFKG